MTTKGGNDSTEIKREEFRKYLERSGVMDTLTKILVTLYEEPEKPEDALGYIKTKLSLMTGGNNEDSIEGLREQLQKCQMQLQQVGMENAQLKGVPYIPPNP